MISIGVHIYPHGFSIVELSLNKGSLKVESNYNHVFPRQSQEEHKQIIILEYLKTLKEKYRNEPIRLCYGLSQNQVSSFQIVLPFKEKFKILKTLPFQIEDKSPFRPDKIFYDGRITRMTNDSSYVTCFVTPENNIHDFLKFSKSLKTKPYLLSVEGAALSNIIGGWNYDPSKITYDINNCLYIYLGFSGSIVLVFKGGYLDSISSIEWGASSIIEQMANKYKLSFEQSLDQFFEKSFILMSRKGFTKEQVFFSNLIRKKVDFLVHQLKLLKLSLETENKIKFEDNIIMGPASVIKNLSAHLSTETSSRFSRLKNPKDLNGFDLSESKNQTLLIPLGLAMEGLKRPPYGGVNFLHSLNKQRFQLLPKKWRSISLGFIITLFLFSIYVLIRNQESRFLVDKVQDVFVDYGKKIASLRESQVSVDRVKDYLEGKESLLDIEELIKKKVSKDSPIDQLKSLTEAINVEKSWRLKITYLKIKNRSVSIKGQINEEFISTFRDRLQKVSQGKVKKLKEIESNKLESDTKELKKINTKEKKLKSKKTKLSKSKEEAVKKGEEKNNLENFSYEFLIKENL